MIVVFTAHADADIEDLADWIAFDNPERAISFAVELRERCLSLATYPNRFPVARDVDGYVLRKMTHGRFLIFYAVVGEAVEIMRVVRASMDWERLFGAQ